MTALALLALAVTVAALIQGAIGVGFALIVAPIAAVVRPDLLPSAILILMLRKPSWLKLVTPMASKPRSIIAMCSVAICPNPAWLLLKFNRS